ncbi:MAG: non-heme iron oxygenase ferredoxin subunit [Chloroflexaceae bacterium]|nr:non-heme iron oxygenase ferredoxin subunit [Chloroflexaceae bacterium]
MSPVRVASVADVPEGSAHTVEVNGHTIVIVHAGGAFYALDNTCSHADASLGEGEVDSDEMTIECPLHGSLFSLETGKPRTLPAYEPVATYPVTIENGELFVEYSD